MRIKLTSEELQEYLNVPTYDFPKYTSQLMNLAGQNSQATRPRAVGQMSDLIQEFPGKTYEEWVAWYKERHPDAIDNATDKIASMIENFRDASIEIDRDLIKLWVEDLVLGKTFWGLKCQEAILKRLAAEKGCDYRLAEPHEESQNIDGFVGDEAYSIKPDSYNTLPNLPGPIEVKKIVYKKVYNGIVFEIQED